MTKVSVAGGNFTLEVEGWDKLWSLHSRLTIPMAHVVRIYAHPDPESAHRWWQGVRVGGTYVPGVITAGTFYHDGNWVFWDVHHPNNAVVIELRDEQYQKLVIEVAEVEETVTRMQAALP